MDTAEPPVLGKSLTARLFLCTIIGSLFVSLVATGVELYLQYEKGIQSIRDNVVLIEKVHVPSISNNLFAVNLGQVELQLRGLLNFSGIVSASIKEEKATYRYRKTVGDPQAAVGFVRTFNLAHVPMAGAEPILLGTLTLTCGYDEIYARLWSTGGIIATSTFAQIFVMGLIVFLLVHYSVTRHLTRMAEYTDRLDLSNLENVLILHRKPLLFGGYDELDQVVYAFNNLRLRLQIDIARRERVQKRLAESEARFRSLTDNLPIGVFRVSPDARIRFANPAFARMFGYFTASDMTGKQTTALLADPGDRLAMMPMYAPAVVDDPGEIRFRRMDGTIFWGAIRVTRSDDARGNMMTLDGTLEDISYRKAAEAAARQHTRELESLNKLAQDTANSYSLETAFHSAIGHLQRLLKAELVVVFLRDGNELKIQAHSQIHTSRTWSEGDPHRVGQCLCGLAVQDRKPMYSMDIQNDYRCVRAECRASKLRAFAAIPLESHGENLGVLGIGSLDEVDFEKQASYLETAARTIAIAIRKILLYRSLGENARQLEGRLRDLDASRRALGESERRFRSFFDSNPEGVLLLDFQGRIQEVNRALCRITGYEPEALRWRDLTQLAADASVARIRDLINGIQKGLLEDGPFEADCLRADGRPFPALIQSLLVQDDNGRPLVLGLFLRDISAERALGEQKAILERQLQHTQKMEAIGTLAGGIAHDFNNILGGIIGFVELAGRHIPADQPRLANYMERALTACNRARDLVEQILKFSRQRDAELEPAALTPLIKEVIQFLRSSLPSTIDIRGMLDAETDWVLADLTQLHQVIMNLCTNAYHAMRDGGVLSLTLKTVHVDNARCFHGLSIEPGRYARLDVSDTGHGIPLHHRDRIFEPYFTTKEQHEGTGLGLSVTFGIIKNHNGLIELDSIDGKGTTFSVFLPVSAPAATPTEAGDKTVPRGNGERILLVDDELYFLDAVKAHLEDLGYDVIDFQDSAQALKSYAAYPGYFDIIITDQTMPGMTGVQLIREIRKADGDIPIMLCTGFSEVVSETSAEEYGIDRFLMKPVHRATLASAVAELLAERKTYGKRAGD